MAHKVKQGEAVKHDGKLYQGGDTIPAKELTEAQAKSLVDVGVVEVVSTSKQKPAAEGGGKKGDGKDA